MALLPVFSKVLEKSVFLQLMNYLEKINLFSPNQHGSRQGHNTSTALIEMYDLWVEEGEAGIMVGVMIINLSASIWWIMKCFCKNFFCLVWMTRY